MGRNVVSHGETFSTRHADRKFKIWAYDPAQRGHECKMELAGV
jgi:hypothetical protein